jgi:hypothetical protein
MISEMVVMLLIGTLQIACPVCDVFLRIPLPGEKTLQKLRGVHNFALGFLGNVSVAERAPSISPNLKMCGLIFICCPNKSHLQQQCVGQLKQ